MRKFLIATTALVSAAVTFAVGPAQAEFKSRNIRVSNGINADHPVGNGIKAMQACLDEKSDGKLKRHCYVNLRVNISGDNGL